MCVNKEPHQMRSNLWGRDTSLNVVLDKSVVTGKLRRQKSKAVLSISAAVISDVGNIARRNRRTRPYPHGKSRMDPTLYAAGVRERVSRMQRLAESPTER